MIDFVSLVLAHLLMMLVALKALVHPDLNEEPTPNSRRFKSIGKQGNPRA